MRTDPTTARAGVSSTQLGALLPRCVPVVLLALLAACAEEAPPPAAAPTSRSVWVEIAGELFELELASDPATRTRGLGGRFSLARNGGMFFVFERPRVLAMVMRDCLIPLDVAFLDATGRVVAIREMPVEPPRGPNESRRDYQARLRVYPSVLPALFAVETTGGRMRELGLEVGDQLVFDAAGLAKRAR